MGSSRKSGVNGGRSFCIGQIVGFHGLRGDVKVRPASGNPDWVGHVKKLTLVLADRQETLTVVSSRVHKQAVLLRFKGWDSLTAVEPMRGAALYVDEADLPSLQEDEVWADDLPGMTVIDAKTGESVGSVNVVLTSGGQDFLELLINGQKETLLIPYNTHFFPNADSEKRQITLSGLEGFL